VRETALMVGRVLTIIFSEEIFIRGEHVDVFRHLPPLLGEYNS